MCVAVTGESWIVMLGANRIRLFVYSSHPLVPLSRENEGMNDGEITYSATDPKSKVS